MSLIKAAQCDPIAFFHTFHDQEIEQGYRAAHTSIDQFTLDPDALALLKDVQRDADNDFTGGKNRFKNYGRYYLHNIFPKYPAYDLLEQEKVLADAKDNEHHYPTVLDAFLALSQQRSFEEIVHLLIIRAGALSNDDVGQILYVLGTLIHATQDFKHREGNGKHTGVNQPISSLEHILKVRQLITDRFPSKAMQARSLCRTEAFYRDFDAYLQVNCSQYREALYAAFATFTADPAKKAEQYRPNIEEAKDGVLCQLTADHLFPIYHKGKRGQEKIEREAIAPEASARCQ
jgi:hypothetical protein